MTERQLQFRVGVFVILAMGAAGAMVFQFGNLKTYLEPRYTLAIYFESVSGVHPSTPVSKNGLEIGVVRDISFDDQQGGVLVEVEIRDEVLLQEDSQPRLVRSLLGESRIDFLPGRSDRFLQPGAIVKGQLPQSPMEIVNRLEDQLSQTVESFNATSNEWKKVARNLNDLLETNHGNLNLVVERAAESLQEFSAAMQSANKTFSQAQSLIGNPSYQENLRKTLEAMPVLVTETHQTIAAVKQTVEKVNQNLSNLNNITKPLARHTTSIVTRLDSTIGNFESLSRELNDFAQLVNKKDGSIQRFASDPQLYRNLNRSAESLAVLLKNIEPILRDVRIFSDKVARHPELIGVSGAFKGSSGLKDPPADDRDGTGGKIRRAEFQRDQLEKR
jgi:phospholipid/cholesterol/gamma-HCH transport system substrate-binding protein